MNSNEILNKIKGELNKIKIKNMIENIKSKYILQIIFDKINKRRALEIIKYNKKMQKKIDINNKDYEKISEIEIEIIPIENEYGQFININKEDEIHYHIYFNDEKKEIKRYNLNREDEITKINIIINYQVKSLSLLFYNCKCIESIYFKKFYKNDIKNMNNMFSGCSSLKQLDLSNFNTNNVTDMSHMFYRCSSLKELNLNNFNTNNVTNMYCMFCDCSSLKELNINNFNFNNETYMKSMFSGCPKELIMKIKNQYKNIKLEAFVK